MIHINSTMIKEKNLVYSLGFGIGCLTFSCYMHQQPPSSRVAGPNDSKSSMRETAAGDPPGLRDQVSHVDLVAHH